MVLRRLARRCCLPAALILAVCLVVTPTGAATRASTSAAPDAPDADPLTEAGRWELFGRGALNDVFFVDGTYGWAAGTGVWKTTDGGATWRRIPVLAGTTFRRLIFADRNRGWALGHDNRVLRTEDGGETWAVTLGGGSGDYSPPLLEYQAPSDLWTVGLYTHYVYPDRDYWGYWTHSTDGGLTWSDPGENRCYGGPPDALDFFDRNRGWMSGEECWHMAGFCAHGLAKTIDAGQTWTYSCLPVTASSVSIGTIGFGSATDGWLAAGAALWRSTDGGDTGPSSTPSPLTSTGSKPRMAAAPGPSTATSSGAPADGGATWQLFTEAAPGRVSFRTSLEGWGTDGSSIFKSSDSGRTWRPVFTLPAARAQEWFWDPMTGWRTVGAAVERTTDGGATWKTANPGLQGIDAFQFVDARVGWAWHNESLGLAHTTDGGATWQGQNTGSAALSDLQFVDAQHGWVHNEEQVRGTIDGGQSWHDLPTPLQPPHPYPYINRRLLFLDATHGWASIAASGCAGMCWYGSWLSHTTDGGSTWGPLEGVPVDSVAFLDRERGLGWYWHVRRVCR